MASIPLSACSRCILSLGCRSGSPAHEVAELARSIQLLDKRMRFKPVHRRAQSNSHHQPPLLRFHGYGYTEKVSCLRNITASKPVCKKDWCWDLFSWCEFIAVWKWQASADRRQSRKLMFAQEQHTLVSDIYMLSLLYFQSLRRHGFISHNATSQCHVPPLPPDITNCSPSTMHWEQNKFYR